MSAIPTVDDWELESPRSYYKVQRYIYMIIHRKDNRIVIILHELFRKII